VSWKYASAAVYALDVCLDQCSCVREDLSAGREREKEIERERELTVLAVKVQRVGEVHQCAGLIPLLGVYGSLQNQRFYPTTRSNTTPQPSSKEPSHKAKQPSQDEYTINRHTTVTSNHHAKATVTQRHTKQPSQATITPKQPSRNVTQINRHKQPSRQSNRHATSHKATVTSNHHAKATVTQRHTKQPS